VLKLRSVGQDASAKKPEARPAVHLTLETFWTIHLIIDLVVASAAFHSGEDGEEILLQASGEASHRSNF
jgi:hypothetical protein